MNILYFLLIIKAKVFNTQAAGRHGLLIVLTLCLATLTTDICGYKLNCQNQGCINHFR